MKPLVLALVLALVPINAALAADPKASPAPLPIRGVTVDVQQRAGDRAPDAGAHIEAPPFAPRFFRAAPAPAAPAAAERRKAVSGPAPSPSPSPSPTPRP